MAQSGNITRTPDLVLTDDENLTNAKVNRAGGGTYRLDEGSVTSRELDVSIGGGFATVASLRGNTADTFTDGDEISIRGYYTDGAGDFGPPLFYDESDTTTADDGLTCFVDSNNARYKRSFNNEINVKWGGAKGDGTTDDSAKIQACVDYFVNKSGGTIVFDRGNFLLSTAITLDYVAEGDDSEGIRRLGGIKFVGSNSTNNDSVFEGETEAVITANSSSTTGIFDLNGVWGCSFHNLVFSNKSLNAPFIHRIRSPDSPVFTSTHTSFYNCIWLDDSTVTTAQVVLRDCKFVSFSHCSWATGSDSFLLGENSGTNSTLLDGDISNITWDSCYFAGDIKFRQARVLSWINCEFWPVKDGSGECMRILPDSGGDEKLRNASFYSCKNTFSGDDTLTFFTQGTSGSGLIVIGGEYGDMNRSFVLNGTVPGNAKFEGVRFRNTSTGARDIEIQSGYGGKVSIDCDHSTTTSANRIAVSEARTLKSSTAVGSQFAFYDVVNSDFTFSNIGSYETILSNRTQLRGGLYRIGYNLVVTSNQTTSYISRVKVGTSILNETVGIVYATSGQASSVSSNIIRAITGTSTTGTDVVIECRQATGTPSLIKANSTTDAASYLIIEEL